MAADNLFSDLARMIEQVGKDKGIDKRLVIDAVTQGMLVAARKKYGTYREIEAQYNEDSGEIELFQFKEVVNDEDFIDGAGPEHPAVVELLEGAGAVDGRAGRILGVHMVGPWVTEQLGQGYLAVNWEATVDEVAHFIQPHPTMSELFG